MVYISKMSAVLSKAYFSVLRLFGELGKVMYQLAYVCDFALLHVTSLGSGCSEA